MAVRAKFRLNSIERSVYQYSEQDENGKWIPKPKEMNTLKFTPVCGNGDPGHENTKFWQASPSGSLELGCVNAEAVQQFELNQEYYLDFTPAE